MLAGSPPGQGENSISASDRAKGSARRPTLPWLIRALQARKVPTKVLTYPPSCHPLEEVEVEADFSINMVRWFEQFL
ncbi:unnamed protein product, partial [Mesorhabditis spiculigera]